MLTPPDGPPPPRSPPADPERGRSRGRSTRGWRTATPAWGGGRSDRTARRARCERRRRAPEHAERPRGDHRMVAVVGQHRHAVRRQQAHREPTPEQPAGQLPERQGAGGVGQIAVRSRRAPHPSVGAGGSPSGVSPIASGVSRTSQRPAGRSAPRGDAEQTYVFRQPMVRTHHIVDRHQRVMPAIEAEPSSESAVGRRRVNQPRCTAAPTTGPVAASPIEATTPLKR